MTTATYILALDQGTSSSRALLIDRDGRIVDMSQLPLTQHYPQTAWVEHDAQEIWQTQWQCVQTLMQRHDLRGEHIAAIGITNQRETTVIWDKRTGQPLARAIVWQDRRTQAMCEALQQAGHEALIQERTGLRLDPYFSASKLAWLLDNTQGARELAAAGHLAFGTIDSWLVWQLTQGALHITDVSNASRTALLNIHTLDWDAELLALFDIPLSVLPQVRPSSDNYGVCTLFDSPVVIGGMAGDQQAALFGQRCWQAGMVKNTYGTGCFMLMNVGETAVRSQHRLLSTVAWQIGAQVQYALEGSVFMGGALVQWVRDELGLITHAQDIEQLARQVPDSAGVVIVPAFAGLGAPYWSADARGAIFGLTRGATRAHIARAALEAIAWQIDDILHAMSADAQIPMQQLRVDGGAATNDLLMQIQADVLNIAVARPVNTESTALGAAYLAGLAVGFWASMDDIAQLPSNLDTQDTVFYPDALHAEAVKQQKHAWTRAVRATLAWTQAS